MIITYPYKMKSEANHGGHWRGRARRTKDGRELATFYVRKAMSEETEAVLSAVTFPCVVTMTRISPRQMDEGDNLERAFKATRDGIADALLPHNRSNQHRTWADDSDGQIEWRYEQRRGEPKQHAVEITIEPREAT